MIARIFQERKMSAGIFVSASESAAYILKKSANVSAALNFGKERHVSGAHKNQERTKGLFLTKNSICMFLFSDEEGLGWYE